MKRRLCLMAGLGLPWLPQLSHATSTPHPALHFPRDLGSHPEVAIEWWYLTGQLNSGPRRFGFQLTFFRSRVPDTQGMRSGFAAKQLVFAHAAVTDVADQRLRHDQRIARVSGNPQLDLATASPQDTDLQLDNWTLKRSPAGYQAQASGSDFSLQLSLQETQPLLLQGEQGWSRKGPDEAQVSCYYSLPQLQASGQLHLANQTFKVQGQAWLDHEWSQSLMPSNAVGWDWIGMNLQDGSALTAFRLRTAAGNTLWAGGSWRSQDQLTPEVLGPKNVVFTPGRRWKSPSSDTTYPVEWTVDITRPPGARQPGTTRYTVKAVVDNQELDSRLSTGAIYWEGLSDLLGPQGNLLGHGYLEMTGYAKPLKL